MLELYLILYLVIGLVCGILYGRKQYRVESSRYSTHVALECAMFYATISTFAWPLAGLTLGVRWAITWRNPGGGSE